MKNIVYDLEKIEELLNTGKSITWIAKNVYKRSHTNLVRWLKRRNIERIYKVKLIKNDK